MFNIKQWEENRDILQQRLIALLGGFPERKPVSGRIEKYSAISDPVLLQVQKQNKYLAPGGGYLSASGPSDKDTFITKRVVYDGMDGKDIPATLRIPKNINMPLPAVLCLHGHCPGLWFGKETTDFFAIPLTEQGYITLAPDALPSGERRFKELDPIELQYDGNAFWGERILCSEYWPHGKTLLGVQLWELMRAVDYLQTRPEVDSQRIGCMGESMGGIHTWWLSALDERIKVAVSAASLISYRVMAERRIVHALFFLVPGILKVCDTPDIISLIAPRCLLTLAGEHDPDFPIDDGKDIHKRVKEIYSSYGAEERIEQHITKGGHNSVFIEETFHIIYNFLKKWL